MSLSQEAIFNAAVQRQNVLSIIVFYYNLTKISNTIGGNLNQSLLVKGYIEETGLFENN